MLGIVYNKKPPIAARLQSGHPLAQGLVACWLMNEGAGNKILDATGRPFSMTFPSGAAAPTWSAGGLGTALLFDDANSQYVSINSAAITAYPFTMACWFSSDDETLNQKLLYIGDKDATNVYAILGVDGSLAGDFLHLYVRTASSNQGAITTNGYTVNKTHFAVGVARSATDKTAILDANFAKKGTNTTTVDVGAWDRTAIGYCARSSSPYYYLSGKIYIAYIWNRALSEAEIRQLYLEPFAIFGVRPGPAVWAISGQVINLEGALAAQAGIWGAAKVGRKLGGLIYGGATSSGSVRITTKVAGYCVSSSYVTAMSKVTRRLTGTVGCLAEVSGSISLIGDIVLSGAIAGHCCLSGTVVLGFTGVWFSLSLDTDRPWLRESLFNGVTATAFKLGTVLSSGWFWMRPGGCSVLYRGLKMEEIDFANALTVVEQDDSEISPPDYLGHWDGTTYFYIVRRFNGCGYQEKTLSAAVKVRIGPNGLLAQSPIWFLLQ